MNLQGMEMPQVPPQPPVPQVGETQQSPENELDNKLQSMMEKTNIAEDLDEELLRKIGEECRKGYINDCASRHEWIEELKMWIDLASQIREDKNWPWKEASNVKYPLVGTAAMQFSARAYPSLVPSNGRIVSTKIYGKDEDQQKFARAERVSKFMSWQILEDMDDWEGDMDKLLMQIAISGNAYKKTYYDPATEKNRSDLVDVADLVVNYWAKDLETAERVSHKLYVYKRQVENKIRQKIYIDAKLSDPVAPEPRDSGTSKLLTDTSDIAVTPYTIIEQHTYYDLDEDGYAEPYIITFEETSGKVLRIVARFDQKDIKKIKNKVVHIGALCYFTKYGFIPNPDGSFYDLGFGHLLGPLNESVNTTVNQLVDQGTMYSLNAGFMGKGLRIRGGDYNFQPNEWKWVNSTVDDLRKQILPLPIKEPSKVLMDLLQYLVGAGKELASIAEIFVGKMPGQNTPATTTQSSIEQGMKVFTAIYKRVYRSLTKEFKKLYRLNNIYLDPNTQAVVLDEPIGPGDFDSTDYDICPAADPSASSAQEKLEKAQVLLQLLPLGTLDPMEVTMRILQAQEQPNWERLIPGMAQTGQPQQQQQADPKMQEMQMKMEAEQRKGDIQKQLAEHKMQLESASAEQKLQMKAAENRIKLQSDAQALALQKEADSHKQKIFMVQNQQKMMASGAQHQQKLVQNQQSHQQKMQQSKETQKSKPSSSKTSGSGKKI